MRITCNKIKFFNLAKELENMYICVCHAVTEKDIKKAVGNGASSISRLSELTMLGTQCGCCTDHANQVLNQCAGKA